jgi:hypothetical protein
VGEDQPGAGVGPREAEDRVAEPRDPAPGVEQDGRAVLRRERHDLLDDRVGQPERVRARVQLEADRAGVEAAAGLGEGAGGVRVQPREREEAAVRRRRRRTARSFAGG